MSGGTERAKAVLKLVKIFWGITWRTGLFVLVLSAGLWWMNRHPGWDGRAALEAQAKDPALARIEGEAGLIVVTLAMPEKFDTVFYENFIDKLFRNVIPWPINAFAGVDAGTALLDPANPDASTLIEPKQLADVWGRTKDIDGVPWVEKYRAGEVRWIKPSATIPHDVGLFIYPKRKGGMRTAAAKTMLKARHIYYARLPEGYLPHYAQTVGGIEGAIAKLKANGTIKSGAMTDGFNPYQMKTSINSVLDSGVDTIVLSSSQPIYSDFEELRGTFSKAHKYIEAWQSRNPGRKVKIVIAPQMGSQPAFASLWQDHLAATAPAPLMPGESAKVIVSLHGLPPSLANSDSWASRYPAVVASLKPGLERVMKAKGYGAVSVTEAYEGFADTIEDPKNVLVSVREEAERAKAEGAKTIVVVPIEFLAENTDTLFSHAALMFEGMPGYQPYDGPAGPVDWSKPYLRSFNLDGARFIYTGSPGGERLPQISAALAQSIETAPR
jgi:hypothetical protein